MQRERLLRILRQKNRKKTVKHRTGKVRISLVCIWRNLQRSKNFPRRKKNVCFEAVNGDSMAKSTLAGQYLETVYELAMTYVASELPIEDLVQEGNIGLLLALENLEAKPNLEEYRKQVFDGLRKAMEEAVEMSQDKKDLDDEIVGRVNHLNESILSLEEDLGHKVSMSELSAYLEMPLEEIKDVLRMAGDEMKDKSDVR